jgi:hypothetical protein
MGKRNTPAQRQYELPLCTILKVPGIFRIVKDLVAKSIGFQEITENGRSASGRSADFNLAYNTRPIIADRRRRISV